MTSPAYYVLFLALACCCIQGTSNTADYDSTDKRLNITMKTQHRTNVNNILINSNYDEIYTENVLEHNLNIHKRNIEGFEREKNSGFDIYVPRKRVKREDEPDPRCESFMFSNKDQKYISHPYGGDSKNNYYYSNLNCVTVISADEGKVVELTFVDMFHIEYHPECSYDFLEIRDGLKGYAKLIDKVCGEAFPRQIRTTGPNAWLKFHSDDTIEYEGFRISINFIELSTSVSIPNSCYKDLSGMHGIIDTSKIDQDCLTRSANQNLDVLWTINTPANTKIYLNFTHYALVKPNECEDNVVEVFGYTLEYEARLAHYCGSVANAITTKDDTNKGKEDKGNIMYVRLFTSKAGRGSSFNATFTAFRSLDPNRDEKCDPDTEFDCADNTCIDIKLKCDNYAHCRLKADEEQDICKVAKESMLKQPHILVILIIFSLILSGMSFVFLFKCIRKLYQDHKIIKEHIRQSCEDRLDSLVSSRLTLDAKRLQRDSEPRASLERDNHTNEMFKQQRKYSQQKIRPTSIDSDFIQETRLDLEDEPWRREVETVHEDDVKIERNAKRKSDISKKEESMRRKETEEKKEIRDVSVGAPDTKESGCQTRESLFQTDPTISSDGSGTTNSRGFSTFGYSGATIARPSPPAPTSTSQITIELLRQVTPQDTKPTKKIPDRRPMSTETTRSAPDVIIVSKPLR
ncbi:neuropilin and tolloid-like protein 1 [Colias croceus]|uniref:neuropilin and tolloid-like protein 1 n=1 Tax=Colias crocea TaxID=72248 RepID=UPI001E27D409|nr:neuropilin and tolloid-like protein 1 [Colias croceus]